MATALLVGDPTRRKQKSNSGSGRNYDLHPRGLVQAAALPHS